MKDADSYLCPKSQVYVKSKIMAELQEDGPQTSTYLNGGKDEPDIPTMSFWPESTKLNFKLHI